MEKNYFTTIRNRQETRLNGSQKSMQTSQLMKLFEDELQVILWAEKALTKAIPLMIKNAASMELIEVLSLHLEETDEQVERLAQIFAYINKKPVVKICEKMYGLIKETEEIMELCEAGAARDAGIILTAQKVEHYEIATYNTLRQFAQKLGLTDVDELLKATLKEEKAANKQLSEVVIRAINIKEDIVQILNNINYDNEKLSNTAFTSSSNFYNAKLQQSEYQ